MLFKNKFWTKPTNEGNLFLKIFFFSILLIFVILGYLTTHNLIVAFIMIGSVLSIWLAYYYPILTIVLLILFGQIIQFELIDFLASFDALPLGGLSLRFSDPIIFGIIVAILIKIIKVDPALKRIVLGKGKYFTIFLFFVLFQVIRNYSIYGSYSFGEFRTYYQGFLIIPYVAMSINSSKMRKRLFVILVILALSQIITALIKGAFIQNFSLDTYEKWLSSFGSLALLYGLFGLYLYRKYKGAKLQKISTFIIIFSGIIILIIASNRSVWLAGIVAFLFLIITKEIKVKHHVALFLISIFVFLLVTQVFTSEGYDFYNFFTQRFYAFTDFKKDPTAAWRYYVWMSMIENIAAQPFWGYGLGGNFNFFIPEFASFFGNSPHNFYLAMMYELGFIGLSLFFIFLINFILDLKGLKFLNITDHIIRLNSYIVIVSFLSYWIAYSTEKDFFTWAFLGLGFSIIINTSFGHINSKNQIQNSASLTEQNQIEVN